MIKSHFLTPTVLVSVAVLTFGGVLPASTQQPTVPSEPTQNTGATPTNNKSVRYECRKDGNKYVTIAHNNRGPIDLIQWQSTYFGPQWTPERRCSVVTQRFQKFSDAKILRFVSYDQLNNYNVLCILATQKSQNCLQDSLLLTLERKDDPVQVLTSLFDTDVIILRGSKPVVDIDNILQTRPLRSDDPASPPEELDNQLSPQSQLNTGGFAVPSELQ